MPEEWIRKNLGGVVGVRLLHELQGQPSIGIDEQLSTKKNGFMHEAVWTSVNGFKINKGSCGNLYIKSRRKITKAAKCS